MNGDYLYLKESGENVPALESFYLANSEDSLFKVKKDKSEEIKDKNNQFVYEKWPSRNRFFCRGRLMMGPKVDNAKLLFNLISLAVFLMPYYLMICPRLWIVGMKLLPIFNGLLSLVTFIFLFLVVFTDPGIIPRKKTYEMLGESLPEKFNLDEKRRSYLARNYYVRDSPDKKSLMIKLPDGANVIIKYCETCEIYRPPRASHCRLL